MLSMGIANADVFLPFGDIIAIGIEICYWASLYGDQVAAGSSEVIQGSSGNTPSLDPKNDFEKFKNKKPLQDHHLIPQSSMKGQNPHNIIVKAKELGVDIAKESWNIVRISHQGGHLKSYYQFVYKQLDKVQVAYTRSGQKWDAETMEKCFKKCRKCNL